MMYIVNETILFGRTGIHVRYDIEKAVEWVSLHDIMKILKRREKTDIEKALKVCKTKQQFPIYTNGALFWFISVADVYTVLKKIRKENKLVAVICDDLITWTGKLPIGRKDTEEIKHENKIKERLSPIKAIGKKVKKIAKIGKEIVLPNHEKEQEAVLIADLKEVNKTVHNFTFNGKEYINITEVSHKYSKNPREWLLRTETIQICESMVEQGIANSVDELIIKKRGHMGATFLEKSLYVDFLRWLDPKIAIKTNEVFNTLDEIGFIKQEESIPEKKTASSSSDNQLDLLNKTFNLPDNLIDALELAAKLYRKIEEDKPKVQFYERMVEQRDNFKSSFLAMELDISTTALHRFLMDEKICFFNGRCYEVYTQYHSLQVDHPYYWTNKKGKTYAHSKVKRWSQFGREYILELYRKKNPQTLIILE